MKWTEIDVTVPADIEETAAACLSATGGSGVQVLRDEPLPQFDEAWTPSIPALPADRKPVTLRAYLPLGADPEVAVRERLLQSGLVLTSEISVASRIVDDSAWSKSWRRFHRPRKIGARLIVQPTWSRRRVRDAEIPIIVDPGMAFGSGQHATTRLCMVALEETIYPGARVVDIGCGSGILSITAAKLGAASVLALDTDPVAVATTSENLHLNGVDNRVTIQNDAFDHPVPAADLVVANILAGVVIDLLPIVRSSLMNGARTAPHGTEDRERVFISSGIVADQEERVRQAHLDHGFQVVRRLQRAEWRCLCARLK